MTLDTSGPERSDGSGENFSDLALASGEVGVKEALTVLVIPGRKRMVNMPIGTIPKLLDSRTQQSPSSTAFHTRNNDRGIWEPIDWQSFQQNVHALASHLLHLGFQPKDRAVIAMPTSIRWETCHHATLAAGGVAIGLDNHDTDTNLRHMLDSVRPTALFLESSMQAERFQKLLPVSPRITFVARDPIPPAAHRLENMFSKPTTYFPDLPAISSDQQATIIFSSGSTGLPKGIAFTHHQLCLVAQAIVDRFPSIETGARLACWLPLSNLFQRAVNLASILRGGQSYFVEDPSQVVELLKEIRPALFIAVPRFYEKLHGGILQEVKNHASWKQHLIMAAWDHSRRLHIAERKDEPIGWTAKGIHHLADHLVLRKIRQLMGPDLQFMVSGSAPIPLWLLESLHGLGWLVLEAYGTSENALPIAMNTVKAYRFGSVGRPLAQNEVRITKDGEILVRGSTVFDGYLDDSEEDTPLDEEGFLHTGDLGRIDGDGFLWLTGRKSEVFKTSTGRRVPPIRIEACLKKLEYVDHAVVFGRGRPFPVALLVLDEAVQSRRENQEEGFLEQVAEDVETVCREVPAALRPGGILVCHRLFSIETGELTANLKLRRNAIEHAYQNDIDSLYHAIGKDSSTRNKPLCKVIKA